MLETLLTLLGWGLPAPEIRLEEDGDILLDWAGADLVVVALSVSINSGGATNWVVTLGGQPGSTKHGTDINELRELLTSCSRQ